MSLSELLELATEQPATTENNNFKPSHYQQAIFDFVDSGSGHGVVYGVAGCGKTTTNVEALKLVNPKLAIKFTAFSKDIQLDIKKKSPDYVSVTTFHVWGKDNILKKYPKIQIKQFKIWDILDRISGPQKLYASEKGAIQKLIGIIKGSMSEPTMDNARYLIDYYGFNIDNDKHINLALRAFHISLEDKKVIDFDDMVYYPAAGLVECTPFDYIFVDEAQDMNTAQMELCLKSLNNNTRMLLIGDPFQSIYAFRGAHIGIMDYMKGKLDATRLPLTISYRAPKIVTELVNFKYPWIDFEGHKDAVQGKFDRVDENFLIENIRPGDAILSRLNAPLAPICFSLIRQGIKASILGRSIGDGLLSLIKKRERLVRVTDLTSLLTDVDIYKNNEIAKLRKKPGLENRIIFLNDQRDTIHAIASQCSTIGELKKRIGDIFTKDAQDVTLSTIHKAKGKEWDRVFIVGGTGNHPMGNEDQENNIRYVRDTRTKKELYYVS